MSKNISRGIIIFGLLLSLFAYAPSFNNIFRSDNWYIANLAFAQPFNWQGMSKSLKFELFGDPRFQPLSHLLVFITHKLFKNVFFLYHIFAYGLHLVNFFLLFSFLKRLHHDLFIPALVSVIFLNLFSHADTVIWAYHNYITIQVSLTLLSLLLIFKGREKPKLFYAVTAVILMGVAFLFYEAVIFTPLLMILLVAGNFKSANATFKRFALTFTFCVLILYFILIPLFLTRTTSPLARQGIDNLYELIVKIVIAIWIALTGLIRICLFSSLAQVPDYYFADLPYLVMKRFSFSGFLLLSIFLLYFIILPSRSREDNRVAIFSALSMFFYLFGISFGRGCFYITTQARYFYFPNLMFLIAISFLLKHLLALAVPELDSFKGIFNLKFLKDGFLSFYLIGVTMINGIQTHRFSQDLQEILSPLTRNIREIERFYRKQANKDLKIFVNFTPHNKDYKLFLGTQIALETYFFNTSLFTRRLDKAKFIYDAQNGFLSNSLYQHKETALNPDFTIEFDFERIGFAPCVNIIQGKDYFLKIIIEDNQEKLSFGGWWAKDGRRQYREFKAKLNIEGITHIVVQKEGDKIYFLQDGRIILLEELEGGRLLFDDQDLFVGTRITFPTQYCFVENFLAFVGKAKYKLKGYMLHDTVNQEGLRSKLKALGSRPVYWLKGIENLY